MSVISAHRLLNLTNNLDTVLAKVKLTAEAWISLVWQLPDTQLSLCVAWWPRETWCCLLAVVSWSPPQRKCGSPFGWKQTSGPQLSVSQKGFLNLPWSCQRRWAGAGGLCVRGDKPEEDSTMWRNVALRNVFYPFLWNKNTVLHALTFSIYSVCFVYSKSALSPSMLDLEERKGLFNISVFQMG